MCKIVTCAPRMHMHTHSHDKFHFLPQPQWPEGCPAQFKYLFRWMELKFCLADSASLFWCQIKCFLYRGPPGDSSLKWHFPNWLCKVTSLQPCFIVFLLVISIGNGICVYVCLYVHIYCLFPYRITQIPQGQRVCFSVLFTPVSLVLRIALGLQMTGHKDSVEWEWI